MEKMREEFEAFVISRMKESGFLEVEVRVEILGVSSDGSYYDGTVEAWWDFWKASRAALCVELPENCKGMALTVSELHKQLDKAGVSYK